MPAKLSYINAQGTEIILDDEEHSFLGELQGREGFDAPEIELTKIQYGNGTEEVANAKLKPRDVTCYFWAETLEWQQFEKKFERLKSQVIQIGNRQKSWGRLLVQLRSGSYVYLDCIYSEGLDAIVRDSAVRVGFSMTFHAEDPLFYDLSTTTKTLEAYDEGSRFIFSPRTHFGSHLHFQSSAATNEETVTLDCFRVYPDIVITGPAANIRIRNKTTDKTIQMESSFSLLADERLEIHTRPSNRGIIWHKQDGTEVKAMRYLTAGTILDWYMINGDNVIQYRNSVVSPLSTCTLNWQAGRLSAN